MSRTEPTPSAQPSTTTFLGGAVVQLVDGDPRTPQALVVSLHGATVEVGDERVAATDGELEWTWLVRDLREVHHSEAEDWSILVVPGVPDHGVAVAASDREHFRRCLEAARSSRILGGPVELADPVEPETLVDRVTARAPAPQLLDPPVVVVDRSVPDLGPGFDLAEDLETATVAPAVEPPVDAVPVARRRSWRLRDRSSPGTDPATPAGLAGLEADEISAWFGSHHVLDRVSLTMAPGQVTALIGPSGCGKSTFLRVLNRMHELIPSASLAGEVRLDGEDIYDPARKLTDARRQIGMVFQKPNPFPAMSIYDNVLASFRLTGTKVSAQDKDDVVEACLAKAGLWTEVRDRLRQPGGGLSGGQQQRLCIARALAIRPRVLLMDEPCSALDPTSTRRIEQTIVELRSEVTIVIVTHNMQQAARVSDQCAFFLAEAGTPGVIVEHGPTDVMFDRPQDERTLAYVNGRFG